MNEKLSFQHIADSLAQKAGVSKKVADSFTKAFFDSIVDALYMGEDAIRVKGLGTFKLVEVGSRESVNVSNGERIVIEGYKKVSFTPENAVVDFLNQGNGGETADDALAEETPAVEEAPAVEEVPAVEEAPVVEELPAENVEDTTDGPEEALSIEELIAVPEPEQVEVPQDEFAGIDLLISTPESLEEVRAQYEAAQAKMEAVLEAARKANAEKLRLAKLLERLEANVVPEVHETEIQESQEAPAVAEDVVTTEAADEAETSEGANDAGEKGNDEEERRRQALERFMRDTPSDAPKEPASKAPKAKRSFKVVWIVLLVLLFVAAIAYFLYQTFRSIEAVEQLPAEVEHVAKPKKATKAPAVIKPDAAKKAPAKPTAAPSAHDKPSQGVAQPQVKPLRPATHVLQKGESLTRLSQRYYGTKDSVSAIIRANHFNDPDNVPAGAVVKLP